MEKRALTNHLRIQINRDAFFQKYSVYRIQTDEDYIRQDARILDLPCLDNRVLGISSDKATMYVMLPAGHDYTFELQNAIKEEDTGGHLIVDKASSVNVPEYTILKLLRQGLGVAPIAIDPPYSNLTGRLFEVVAKKKDILICLELCISKEYNLYACVHTFGSKNLDTKGRIQYSKGKGWKDYPHYVWNTSTGTLTRSLKGNEKGMQYIMRSAGSRNTVEFLNVGNLAQFNNSKAMYILEFMRHFNRRYRGIAEIAFDKTPAYQTIRLTNDEGKELTSAQSQSVFISRTRSFLPQLAIVDKVGDNLSVSVCNALKQWFGKEENGNTHCMIRTRIQSSVPNLVLVHDKEFYQKKEVQNPDPYISKSGSRIIQHVTIETLTQNGEPHLPESVCRAIRKEILIQQDLHDQIVRAVDLSMFRRSGRWIFAIKTESEQDDVSYHFMTLYPDDTFSISSYPEFSVPDEFFPCIRMLHDDKTECVIRDDTGHNAAIRDTGLFIVPDKEIQEVLISVDEHNNTHPGKRKIGIRGSRPIMEDTPHPITNPRKLFESVSHINYYDDEEKFRYWAGIIAAGTKSSIPKAEHIREITGENAIEIGNRLIPTFANTVIRNGQFSVLPFAAKYLREAAAI